MASREPARPTEALKLVFWGGVVWVGLFWFEIFGGQVLISLHCTRFRVSFYFTSIVTFVLVLRSLWRTFHSDAFECWCHCVSAVVKLRSILEQLFNKTLFLKFWFSYREEEKIAAFLLRAVMYFENAFYEKLLFFLSVWGCREKSRNLVGVFFWLPFSCHWLKLSSCEQWFKIQKCLKWTIEKYLFSVVLNF